MSGVVLPMKRPWDFPLRRRYDKDEARHHVCAECLGEIRRVGEDALDWCEDCQQVEGDTLWLTDDELEERLK